MAETISTILDSIRSVVEQKVLTDWVVTPGGARRSPIQFPGVNELLKEDGTMMAEAPVDTPWLKVEIQWNDTEEVTFAGGSSGALNRNSGTILLKVFAPNGQGTSQLEQWKGYARTIFSRFVGSGLRCRASGPGPNLPERAWLVGVIATPFECYESLS
jgi:hypothetical protein